MSVPGASEEQKQTGRSPADLAVSCLLSQCRQANMASDKAKLLMLLLMLLRSKLRHEKHVLAMMQDRTA